MMELDRGGCGRDQPGTGSTPFFLWCLITPGCWYQPGRLRQEMGSGVWQLGQGDPVSLHADQARGTFH